MLCDLELTPGLGGSVRLMRCSNSDFPRLDIGAKTFLSRRKFCFVAGPRFGRDPFVLRLSTKQFSYERGLRNAGLKARRSGCDGGGPTTDSAEKRAGE